MTPTRAHDVAATAIVVTLLFSVGSDCRVIPDQPELEISDANPGCYFPLSDQKSSDLSAPLILNSTQSNQSNQPNLIYPDVGQHEVVWIETGQEIGIFCPGRGNAVVAKTSQSNRNNVIPAYCTSTGEVYTDNGLHNAPDIACKRPPRSRAKENGNTCAHKNTEITVGFPISGELVPAFTTCFDKHQKEALYAKHTVSKAVKTAAKGVSRPSFDPANFYDDIPVNDLYKQTTQLETLGKILNSTELAGRYIKPNSAKTFLARGHLAPKADFIYAPEQRATFYYVNVAPQWMSFNAGSWNTLETSVRNLAHDLGRDLDVYTGTFGVSTLPDAKGRQQELYLYVDENDNKAVSVPKVFWKFVYDSATNAGVVVVGVNNPYVNPVPQDYFLCENDVCDKVGWLNFDRRKISKGYVYCCQVDDFRQSVDYLPDVPVADLLA